MVVELGDQGNNIIKLEVDSERRKGLINLYESNNLLKPPQSNSTNGIDFLSGADFYAVMHKSEQVDANIAHIALGKDKYGSPVMAYFINIEKFMETNPNAKATFLASEAIKIGGGIISDLKLPSVEILWIFNTSAKYSEGISFNTVLNARDPKIDKVISSITTISKGPIGRGDIAKNVATSIATMLGVNVPRTSNASNLSDALEK